MGAPDPAKSRAVARTVGDPRAPVIYSMVQALHRQRRPSVEMLRAGVAGMVEDLDRERLRDHRSSWLIPLDERNPNPDMFDRVRYCADDLCVISIQMLTCDPYSQGPDFAGPDGCLALLGLLVGKELAPLAQLERDVPAVQLQRAVRTVDHRVWALPRAVRDMRRQHVAAEVLCELFTHLQAAA